MSVRQQYPDMVCVRGVRLVVYIVILQQLPGLCSIASCKIIYLPSSFCICVSYHLCNLLRVVMLLWNFVYPRACICISSREARLFLPLTGVEAKPQRHVHHLAWVQCRVWLIHSAILAPGVTRRWVTSRKRPRMKAIAGATTLSSVFTRNDSSQCWNT